MKQDPSHKIPDRPLSRARPAPRGSSRVNAEANIAIEYAEITRARSGTQKISPIIDHINITKIKMMNFIDETIVPPLTRSDLDV